MSAGEIPEVLRTRLIEAMLGEYGQGNSIGEDVERMLDAALALCSPCQTCGGDGKYPRPPETRYEWTCPTCGGSGQGSSVPVLVEYLMEQVGWQLRRHLFGLREVAESALVGAVPVWVYKENRDQ